jgi:hypothetical protein
MGPTASNAAFSASRPGRSLDLVACLLVLCGPVACAATEQGPSLDGGAADHPTAHDSGIHDVRSRDATRDTALSDVSDAPKNEPDTGCHHDASAMLGECCVTFTDCDISIGLCCGAFTGPGVPTCGWCTKK